MQSPPAIMPDRRGSIVPLAVCIALFALSALVLFLFNPSSHGFFPRCMLYVTTGLYCPGCGALRSLHQLTHGNVVAAMQYNPLLVLALPFLAWLTVRFVLNRRAGNPRPFLQLRAGWIVFLVVLLIAFSLLRNIPLAAFDFLRPPPAVEKQLAGGGIDGNIRNRKAIQAYV